MNFKKNALVLTVFLIASSAHAELARSNKSTDSTQYDLRECKSYRSFKHESIVNGTKCIVKNEDGSTKGIFERVESGTKEIESGIVIVEELFQDKKTLDGALKECSKMPGVRLPSEIEVKTLEEKGFRDLGVIAGGNYPNSRLYWVADYTKNGWGDVTGRVFNTDGGRFQNYAVAAGSYEDAFCITTNPLNTELNDYLEGYKLGEHMSVVYGVIAGLQQTRVKGNPFYFRNKVDFCESFSFISDFDKSSLPQVLSNEFLNAYSRAAFAIRDRLSTQVIQNDIDELLSNKNLTDLHNRICLSLKN